MTEKKLDEILFILGGLKEDMIKCFFLLKPKSQETFKKELKETYIEETLKGDPIPEVLDIGATYTIDQKTFEYQEKSYDLDKFRPCKYKCGFWTAWGQPYVKGDRILHINPATKEIMGFNCPKFEGR